MKIRISIFSILYFSLFIITFYVLYGCILIDDDLLKFKNLSGIGDNFQNPEHGYLFPWAFGFFISYKIPHLLNLNLQDYHILPGAFFRALYIVLEVFVLVKILFAKFPLPLKKSFCIEFSAGNAKFYASNKIKNDCILFKILSILFCYMCIFFVHYKWFYTIMGWTAFSRLSLPMLILLGIVYYFSRNICFGYELTIRQKIVLYLLLFLAGMSGELQAAFLLIFLPLLFLFSDKKIFLINSMLPFCAGFIYTITRRNFIENILVKLSSDSIQEFFEKKHPLFDDMPNIVHLFFKDVIFENIISCIIIICSSILLLFMYKKKYILKHQAVFSFAAAAASFLTFAALLIPGRVNPEFYYIEYYFSHNDLKPAIGLFLIMCCLINFSFLYEYFNKKKYIMLFILADIIMFFSFKSINAHGCILQTGNFYSSLITISSNIKNNRIQDYVLYKIPPSDKKLDKKCLYISKNNYIDTCSFRGSYQDKILEVMQKEKLTINSKIKFIDLYKSYEDAVSKNEPMTDKI